MIQTSKAEESISERRCEMSKMKMVGSWCIPMVLIVVALMTPAVAQGGAIKIWPDQLKPTYPNAGYTQSLYAASNGEFYAPLSLPVGARIVKLTFFHKGSTAPAYTWVWLGRVKMGAESETLGNLTSTDSSNTIIKLEVPITGDAVIRGGYRYYLGVVCGSDSWFRGARIDYQE